MNLIKYHKAFTSFLTGDDYAPVPGFHEDILTIYQKNERLQLIVAPVGFAKSSTLRSSALYNLIKQNKFSLYVSSTASKVAQHFSSFQLFARSQAWQQILGFSVVKANEDEIIINIGGQQRCLKGVAAASDISGINFQSQRPQMIFIDDLEELATANSIERTNKLQEWLETTLLSRLPSLVEGKVRMIGTNLTINSIVNRMITKKIGGWAVYVFKALLEDNTSIWEQRHPAAVLLKEQQERPVAFARNYQNEPVDTSNSLIKYEDLRFYDYVDINKFKKIYMHADTTHTAKTSSDYFCLMAIGENIEDKNYYVLDYCLEKITPEVQAERCIVMYQKYKDKVKRITYDEKANQGFGYWSKKIAKEKYNLSLPLEELKYGSDKVTHFEPHIVDFRANRVYLPSRHRQAQEAQDQLLCFPQKGVNDDFVDGLSGCLDNFTQATKTAPIIRSINI